ncbi:hypothetical protein ATCC90586_010458 [Pythium insidiosum]|nr:hypothetical protein ATCC90586_010458 [Pythium insidiosum]
MMDRIRELCRAVNAEYKRKTSATSHGDLPQEVEEGNVEYKLQLLDPAPDRVKHLTTQLHWRLNEGKGVAFYEVGVRDNGEAIGIPLPSMIKSICTLARMCQVLNADMEIVRFRNGHGPSLRAARIQVSRICNKPTTTQLRVSVIGDFESGKSTLVGVLTRGCLDDGCGLARMQVFRHRHEIENGCTSSISEHTIGITAEGRFCIAELGSDCLIREDEDDGDGEKMNSIHVATSKSSTDLKSLITFSDLAGHKKYFKITASGLASQFPDYAMLVVDGAKGVQPMTVEHLRIAIALEVAVFVVITKTDSTPAERIADTVKSVEVLFDSVAPEKTIDKGVVPVMFVSSVSGHGIGLLQDYLAALSPKRNWMTKSSTGAEFQINKAYDFDDDGTIVTGLVQHGTISVGESLLLGPDSNGTFCKVTVDSIESLLLGPDSNGTFCKVTVDSIEVQRKAVPLLAAGETGALLIKVCDEEDEDRTCARAIRKGMMLLHPSVRPMATLQFDAEVHFLKDSPARWKENYQAVVHAGRIRQMAKVVRVETPDQASPRAICRFEFMYWPEYMRPDIPLVLREDCAFAVGKVVRAVHFTTEHSATVRTGTCLGAGGSADASMDPSDLHLAFDGVAADATASTSTTSPSKKPGKTKKRRGVRAQTIEEVFATISTVRSSGLNPPPEHIVLTPRSAEACLRCGVNPETLKIRDLESFYDSDITPAVQRMRHEAYSMRRHEQMKAVRAEKKRLVAEDDAHASGANKSPSPPKSLAASPGKPSSNNSSPEREGLSLIEIERRRLEKVKRRQERELEQMLEFEIKLSKIQEEAAEKLERERRLAEQRERERMRHAQELAEEKRQREIKKKAQQDAEEERRRILAAEMAARDREMAEQKARQDRLRRIEARQREEERKQKAEEHRQQTEAILKQQQAEIQERLQQLELAERTRNEMLEEQRQERAVQMEERRHKVLHRIRKNLKQARKVELQRKREIRRKQEASERLRRKHEEEMERQRELTRQEQELADRKRRMALEEARREEERRKELLLQRQREIEANVQHVQMTQAQQLELKKEYRRIQQQLKLDKVERMKRIQEYKRLETLRKLQETEERTQALLNEKEELVQRRKQLAVHTKIQRDTIMRIMDNVKITKKWGDATKTINKVMKASPSPTRSPLKERPKSSSGALPRNTSLPVLTRPQTPGASSAKQSRVFRPPSPPPTRTAFKFTKDAQEAADEGLAAGPQAYMSPYDHAAAGRPKKASKHLRSAVRVVEVEVTAESEARAARPARELDEMEAAARAEEERRAAQRSKASPEVESLIADFDHDGHVGSNEIKLIKQTVHSLFDRDDSGGIDSQEIRSVARDDAEDVQSAFSKLDRDHDSIISLEELDERWEKVGAEMTVAEVVDWVAYAVQLPQYADQFRQHSISGYTFPLLMQDEGSRLREIGVDREMHRQQLAMFIRRKYLGMGRKPDVAVAASCAAEHVARGPSGAASTLLYVSWTAAEQGSPQRFQLQRRSPGEAAWALAYSGPDTEFVDVVDGDQRVMYRLATWNSYGRSAHVFIRCSSSDTGGSQEPHASLTTPTGAAAAPREQPAELSMQDGGGDTPGGIVGLFKAYLWWLDEAIALALFIMLPIRGLIYGDANYLLKVFRRLPPNMPTRVTVEAEPAKTTIDSAAVTVSWEKPADNGVPIVCYCVRWTRLRNDEVKWVKLLTLPLPTTVCIEKLQHGETYKFVVEATNEFGLVTVSSRSTYMVPVPELKGKLLAQRSIKEAKVQRNQCYVCQDPVKRKLVPFSATLNRRILHFCCRCDREFCHHHKGEVFHTKALSCPAVDGQCLCGPCKEKLS